MLFDENELRLINKSRPCLPNECLYHSDHPPCDAGWIHGDQVCPCWAARRLLQVHTSGPIRTEPGPPMPALVRAAWTTAKADARPLPEGTKPKQRITYTEPARAIPADPRIDAVLAEIGCASKPGTRPLFRLRAAIAKALGHGWHPDELIDLLKNTTDPAGRAPEHLWAWTCEHLEPHVRHTANADWRPA